MQIAAKPSMMNPIGVSSGMGHNHGETRQNQAIAIAEKYESSEAFEKAHNLIADAYYIAEDALAKDKLKEAKTALFALNIIVSATIPNSFELSEKALEKWNDLRNRLISETENTQHWKSIDEARKAFNGLSQTMLSLEQSFGHDSDESYYEIFCPLAFNNTGASWLSKEKDINNPYFGASMLKCGEVKQEYKSSAKDK
jgi:Cu(I)/Ag(I) efflux system membrane fusion protein